MCILTDTVAKSRKFPLWADAAVYLSIPGHICVAYWVAPNQDKGGWEEWLKYLWERGDRSSRSLTISWILALKCHPGQWRCKREASQNCHVIQSNQLNTLLLISQIVLLLCWFEFVHQVLQYNHALHFAAWSLSLPSWVVRQNNISRSLATETNPGVTGKATHLPLDGGWKNFQQGNYSFLPLRSLFYQLLMKFQPVNGVTGSLIANTDFDGLHLILD